MVKQILNFRDSVCIAQPMSQSAKDDALKMIDSDSKTALKVTIDATHSGVLTNWRVYPGNKVAKGYRSFFSKDKGGTAEFDKPVLKHHDSYSDPIGRIVSARYTMYKSGADFDLDYLAPESYGNKGSGVVTIDALITDPDSIKKIIDGRFISVSSGHSTDSYLCSICGDSITKCDHMPSKRYNAEGEPTGSDSGNLCYVITNNMTYNECSFVNMPAQPPAKLINFNWADCKDSIDTNLVVGTMVTGAKDLVRVFSLVDSNDEINLLTGHKKSDSKKTVVAVNTATVDKLKAALSKSAESSDDDKPIRQESKEQKVEQPETDQKATSNPLSKDENMDIVELQKKIDGLEKDLSTAKTKASELETLVKAKDAEITKLSEESKNMDSKMRKTLATSLFGLKLRLKKSDVANLDSADKRAEVITKLAQRTVESLEDAVSDLMIELDSIKEDKQDKNLTTANSIVESSDKLTDPTLSKGTDKSKTKDKKTSVVDTLDKELGL